jgi:hypothetical protein
MSLHPSAAAMNVAVYGDRGIGKTTAVLRAFTDIRRVVWIECDPNGAAPVTDPVANPHRGKAGELIGPVILQTWRSGDLRRFHSDVRDAVVKAVGWARAGSISAIVIDTASTWLQADLTRVQRHTGIRTEGGGQSRELGHDAREVFALLMSAGVVNVTLFHEKPPYKMKDVRDPGGIFVSGQTGREIYGMISTVLRMKWDSVAGLDGLPTRQRALACDPSDADWPMKDRYGVCPLLMPADMRAVLTAIYLRSAGREVPPLSADRRTGGALAFVQPRP